jgi:hypothetical protein
LIRDLGNLHKRPFVYTPVMWRLLNLVTHRRRELGQLPVKFLGQLPGMVTLQSSLEARVFRPHAELSLALREELRRLINSGIDLREVGRYFRGECLDYGVISTRVVTTAGVNFIVDAFQNTTEVENFKYHGYGTGTNAEASGDTALQTEETTQYATDNTRPTGSQGEGASANIYRTTATYSPDSGGTRAITEHGIFSQAATGGGTLLDRSVFSAINLVASADSLQTQYDLTMSAGG